MVIDTSVVAAILFGEPEAPQFASAIAGDQTRLMSVASILEASIVFRHEFGDAGDRELDLLLFRAAIESVDVTAEQLTIARIAHREFGKGIHPAALNFGDCFSYALSKATGEPLLFKGNDFAQTDVAAAL